MTSEMRERVDRAFAAFEIDVEYAIEIVQQASQLLARRGELPHAYPRGERIRDEKSPGD